uniref:Peptidase S9 prolyl oligopeptidase catalytic domain-containing protein n=1 Tax=Parascaris univalens TaxID=6257 RepID=A0A915ALI3_PARUN
MTLKPVSHKQISVFYWTAIPNIILFVRDDNGDENARLYKFNITKSSPPNKPEKISTRANEDALVVANNLRDPKVIVAVNNEDPAYHNLYELNLYTNELTLILRNHRFSMPYFFDNDLHLRYVSAETSNESLTYYSISKKANRSSLTSDDENWTEYIRVSKEDYLITIPVGFTANNKRAYWIWAEGSDLGKLVVHDFGRPKNNEVLYEAQSAEIDYSVNDVVKNILIHPKDKTILAVTETYHRPVIHVINSTIKSDIRYLKNLKSTDSLIIVGTSQDFNTWLVTYLSDRNPPEYFLYHRDQKKAVLLIETYRELKGKKLGRMIGFNFNSHDNFTIQAYLSLPPDVMIRNASHSNNAKRLNDANMGLLPAVPQKMIVYVHGGPQYRDRFGFSAENIWLTNRGYAVLQVNFRGSIGFGKRIANAGNGEWGRKMHSDLIDAINFAIQRGIANRSQIAIMGGSYGGYATLIGMTFTPEVFACGVDSYGPSNLVTLLESMPPTWNGSYYETVTMIGGDKNTPEGRKFLHSRSPLFLAYRVQRPLIILQGANDPRIKRSESDKFVSELQRHGIPVTYVLFPDEGHGFRKPCNVLAEAGFREKFLHDCLHGRYEEFLPGQYNSSAVVVTEGSNTPTSLSKLSRIPSANGAGSTRTTLRDASTA